MPVIPKISTSDVSEGHLLMDYKKNLEKNQDGVILKPIYNIASNSNLREHNQDAGRLGYTSKPIIIDGEESTQEDDLEEVLEAPDESALDINNMDIKDQKEISSIISVSNSKTKLQASVLLTDINNNALVSPPSEIDKIDEKNLTKSQADTFVKRRPSILTDLNLIKHNTNGQPAGTYKTIFKKPKKLGKETEQNKLSKLNRNPKPLPLISALDTNDMDIQRRKETSISNSETKLKRSKSLSDINPEISISKTPSPLKIDQNFIEKLKLVIEKQKQEIQTPSTPQPPSDTTGNLGDGQTPNQPTPTPILKPLSQTPASTTKTSIGIKSKDLIGGVLLVTLGVSLIAGHRMYKHKSDEKPKQTSTSLQEKIDQ